MRAASQSSDSIVSRVYFCRLLTSEPAPSSSVLPSLLGLQSPVLHSSIELEVTIYFQHRRRHSCRIK